ncbi:tRNA glutamyl-Q(34) synthetase GluQRS [Pseudomonas sp. MYb185]|uniref:tRNA glutamyl-Q(34) synthetase GluQRS n=1 Tax=Pseudomonas sp. MYb185 TaxID=1848729 RepID=UPI000CFB5BFA|nr:tRNA glutamyl-Q(34) synthetase GluQRS [Pseudomonas sp. MYb185]PRB79854.1 tRNA glutamyl-Q(34) synthetase GluQRS [Pseudomonas sp. MYb185]
MAIPPSAYTGRFAPTPSGYLHFGSLLAAVASYLDARHHQGHWLVRIEDLDTPRNIPGASEHILRTLEAYGLHWDGEVVRQSERLVLYQDVIDHWLSTGQAYHCDCSRREIIAHDGVYPGTCRERQLPAASDHAVRVKVSPQELGFDDRLQGRFSQNLASSSGDFIVRRRDGIIAYQLAVVVDDIAQGVTDIVRGADLLDSTPRQLWLYRLLQQPAPRYLHVPLIMRHEGEKLSKRLGSTPLEPEQASATLHRALRILTPQPPAELGAAPVAEQLQWAIAHWQPQRLPAVRQILESTQG